MKPGSLRIVGKHPEGTARTVNKYEPDQEEDFYRQVEYLEDEGYKLWLYEMTDKGWTEF